MLTETQIESNKERFLTLVNAINRDGMNKELLIKQLTQSDFFTAPASTNYHCNYPGGLCEHSLNVYYNLIKLYSAFFKDGEQLSQEEYQKVAIVSLFHDFSKMNYYTTEIKNMKVYSESGSKKDSMGNYDWQSVQGYVSKPVKDRFMIGNHEENSAYMTNAFIPLTEEEYCAIIHHHGSVGYDSTKQNPADFWIKYPLSLLLYQADCIATFVQENNE